MARLLTGSELNSEIENLIRFAEKEIVIVSPYIKLHDRLKDILKIRKLDHLSLTIVFGKNVNEKSKSISIEDVEFFTEFSDVEIRYEERLHAKYYANEQTSIITSMNLYDFSMNNNIEFGVLNEKRSTLGKVTNFLSEEIPLDDQAQYFVYEIIENSRLIYKKVAIFERKLLKKKFVKSEEEVNEIQSIFKKKLIKGNKSDSANGFCIRTGDKIPFNPKKPFTIEAYKLWAKYKNPEYPEKFCHMTGKSTNGRTSFSKPILGKEDTSPNGTMCAVTV